MPGTTRLTAGTGTRSVTRHTLTHRSVNPPLTTPDNPIFTLSGVKPSRNEPVPLE